MLLALALSLVLANTADGEHSVYACQDEHMQLDCSSGRLVIVRAVFGRYTVEYCNPESRTDLNTSCGDPHSSIQVVTKLCAGRTSCVLAVSDALFGHDPCPDTRKYAEVHFACRQGTTETASLPAAKSRTASQGPSSDGQGRAEGCVLDDKLLSENESWSEGPCVQCRCRDGQAHCEPVRCPALLCEHPLPAVPGLCCPVCPVVPPSLPRDAAVSPTCPAASRLGSTWPASPPGVMLTQCPLGAQGQASWRCGASGWQGDADWSACESDWSLQLERALHNDSLASGDVVHELAEQLQRETLFVLDLERTVSLLDSIRRQTRQEVDTGRVHLLRTASPDAYVRQVTEDLVGAVDSLLATRHNGTWLQLSAGRRQHMASSILASVEDSAFQMAFTLGLDEGVAIARDHLRMDVRHLSADSGVLLGSNSTHVAIPAGVLPSNGSLRVVAVEYRGIQSYLAGDNVTVASHLLSVSLNEPDDKALAQGIQLTFRRRQDLPGTPVCAAWLYSHSTLRGSWSSSGCRTLAHNHSHVVCTCQHLTSFAVLMDATDLQRSDDDRRALTVITYVGCAISIVCLALAAITFHAFRALQGERNTIHKNLVLCLLAGEALFLAAMQPSHTPMLCTTVAVLLHLAFLAAFAWMALEGVHIYVMLVHVFDVHRPTPLVYYLLGYGPALGIVVVTLAVRHDHYGTQHYCWLDSSDGVLWAFLGPVALVMLVNSVFLAIALYVMCTHHSASKRHNARTWLKGACVLIVLLGLTWLLGFLFLLHSSSALAYVFTVLNSLQGTFIFLFHCLLNEHVRREYHKVLVQCSWLPECIRLRYGGHVSLSKETTQSTSSTNPLLRLWSPRRPGKSCSFSSDKSPRASSRPRGPSVLPSRACVSSHSLLPTRPSSELVVSANGELRVVLAPVIVTSELELDLSQYYDVSVLDSEAVSDYCREQLRGSSAVHRGGAELAPYSSSYLQPRRLSAILETEKALSHSDVSATALFDLPGHEQRHSSQLAEAYPDAAGLPRTGVSGSEHDLLCHLLSERASALGLSKSRPHLDEDSTPAAAPPTARHWHSLPRSAKYLPPEEDSQQPVASGTPSDCSRLLQRLTRDAEGGATLRDSGFGDESDRDNAKDDVDTPSTAAPGAAATLAASDC